MKGLAAIVGFLVLVEFASGILQGYYTPIYPQIAEHLSIHEGDINWFEAAQLIVSALCIPLLARLGDLIGHKKVLLISTAVDRARLVVAGVRARRFTTFLVGWAIQGAYVVWLPLEIAIIHRRTRGSGRQELLTRRGAAILVGSLELAVIVGALTSGLLVDSMDMNLLLALPAVVVTAVFFVILSASSRRPASDSGSIDWTGLALITVALGVLMGGLVVAAARRRRLAPRLADHRGVRRRLRGLLALRAPAPRADRRRKLLASPAQWPVQLTAFLFGIPVLGGQIPLSTYAQADPAVRGYGLGADSAFISTLIGLYVVTLAIGAFTLPLTTRLLGRRTTCAGRRVRARRSRLPAVAAVPRRDLAGADQHGDRRPRLGRARRRAAGRRRGRRPARAHRHRDRHDQRHQDRRRCHRLGDLRDRADRDRVAGRDGGEGRPAERLPRRLGGLRRRVVPRGAGPDGGSEARLQ